MNSSIQTLNRPRLADKQTNSQPVPTINQGIRKTAADSLTLFPHTGHSQNRVTASSSPAPAPTPELLVPLGGGEPTGLFLFPAADERPPPRLRSFPAAPRPCPGEAASNLENALFPLFSFPSANGSQVAPGLLPVDRDGDTPPDRAVLGLEGVLPWRSRANASSCWV